MTLEEKLQLIAQSGIAVMGDFVLEKHVDHEIGIVENGGIGIQIVQQGRGASAKDPTASAVQRKPAVPQKSSPHRRELMTFDRLSLSDAHLRVLFLLLSQEHWISGHESDWLALFSARQDSCRLSWLDPFGKGTLRDFFRIMVNEGLISVPRGFSLDHILEGHFTDTQGHPLTGMNSSGEANAKALPFIHKCITLLHADLTSMAQDEILDLMGAHVVNDENRSRRR